MSVEWMVKSKDVRRIAIFVNIDPDSEDSSSTRNMTKEANFAGADMTYAITVSDAFGGSRADKLAHELGHMLGEVFELPAAVNDPRNTQELPPPLVTMGSLSLATTAEQRERIVASEASAWCFAAKMRPNLDIGDATKAFDTYNEWETPPISPEEQAKLKREGDDFKAKLNSLKDMIDRIRPR